MKLLSVLMLVFVATTTFGAAVIDLNSKPAQYTHKLGEKVNEIIGEATTLDAEVTAMDAVVDELAATTGEGESMAVHIARFTYNVATDLGTVAAHGTGVTLPAKAIIIRSWFYTDVQFVDAGSGTVALSCEDADNIYAAADITGNAVGAIVEGVSTGAASAFVSSIAAACEITATVATAAQTAGKLTGYVMYVVHD